ncbi:helix-turn-helix domain-containing protein [Pedobacter sp. LMG 31464]|uniref:Helix-turn-helix domain-containing protein n=1 Tax=Pedobacter planticolens TaxID=2679964 RepID=A0A923ITU0_9SPHI|nr:AraC family transcriptional regulator [Pedobacter planticolens]MBB2145155.1 helix-turn-helix domain-containing protein [Pedobacter planticolens]
MIKRILTHSFSLMNVDLVKLDSKWNYRNVVSPYHRVYYITGGEGEISHFEKKLKLEKGYLYIIPSFTLCNLSCDSFLEQYFIQFFEESSDGMSLFASNRSIFKVEAQEVDVINFKRLLSINPGRGINRSDDPKIYEKDVYYKEYQELNMKQNTSQFLETQGILLQLVARFTSPEIIVQRKREHIPVKILDTISYIVINLHTPLSVKSMAERVYLNPEYFSRLFEQYTGMRPLAYINEKRIERAQYLIMTSRSKYTEIAKMTGFESLSHFSRTFKRITGMSAKAYEKFL